MSPSRHRRKLQVAALVALLTVYLGTVLPVALNMGSHLEEAAGLVPVLPERVAEPQDAAAPLPRLHASRWLPVWGHVAADASYVPLMVDGHIGGLGFLPHRWACALGGLIWARLLAVATGALVVLGLVWAGHALGLPAGGWLAGLLAASSSHFAILHHWVRPDEHLTYALPLAGAACLVRLHRSGHLGWWHATALLCGATVAAKSTGAWTVLAAGLALVAAGLLPRVPLRHWPLAAALAAVPLLPQAVYVLGDAAPEAFAVRLRTLPTLQEAMSWDRLVFFARHFAVSFGGAGEYLAAFARPAAMTPTAGAVGSGVALAGGLHLVGLLVATLACVRRSVGAGRRAFGFGLAVLLGFYVSLYYVGMSLFALLTPWVPLATGLVLGSLWHAAAERPGASRRAGRAAVALVAAALVAQAVTDGGHLRAALASPRNLMFARGVQEQVAADLLAAGVARPWTTTYTAVGVLEVLTAGRIRPRHGFEAFAAAIRHPHAVADYDAAWDRLLTQMARQGGRQLVLLEPSAGELDVSPLRHPAWLHERLPAAVARAGGRLERVRSWSGPDGTPLQELVAVTLPPRAASGSTAGGDSATLRDHAPPARADEAADAARPAQP